MIYWQSCRERQAKTRQRANLENDTERREKREACCEEARRGKSGERSAEVRNHELNAGTVQESGGFGEPKGVKQRDGRGVNIRV